MRSRGFTLVEMLFAVAIVGFLGLAALGFFEGFSKQARVATDLGKMDGAFRSFGQKFQNQLQSADAAQAFQRLPVPVGGCGADGPCVLKLDASNKLVAANASLVGGVTWVDFFADRSATLSTRSLGEANAGLKLRYGKPLNLAALRSSKERVYTTWRLNDTASKPFVMMTRSRTNEYFELINVFGTSTPASRWVPWTSTSPDVNVQSLVGSLVVIYNGYDTNQYFVQRIVNALNCTNARNACLARFSLQTSDNRLDENAYALELAHVTDSDINLSAYMPALPVSSGWGSQPASIYMFPTLTASIEHATNTDFSTPTHVLKLEHYFHTTPHKAHFIAVPIELHSYTLKQSGKRLSLVRRTFPSNQSSVMLDDIPLNQSVIFSRLIGSSNVSVMLYDRCAEGGCK